MQLTATPTFPLKYYATAAYPCSYIDGRIARSQVAEPGAPVGNLLYSDLVRQGFRRSGSFIYRPHCDHCQACTSIRIAVNEFQPDRSQQRAARKHGQLSAHISKPFFSEEHYALYQRYQHARHAHGGMDTDDVVQYKEFLVDAQIDSYLIEFREKNLPHDLRMVSIVDQLDDGWSAVYTFYEPLTNQSFGTFNVLWQIEHVRCIGLPYLYLGYWIEDCQKMSYKTRFKPNELLLNGHWLRNTL